MQTITLPFPVRGLNRRHAIQDQPPLTTIDSKNVWPFDPTSGRERGGVRPPIKGIGSTGAPYNWCPVSYVSSGTKIGVAVTHAGGTYVTLDGADWTTAQITTAPGTNFSSCAVYLQKLYQARTGGTCKFISLPTTGGGTDLSNAGGGTAPATCGLVVAHGDRLWLAGDSAAPHVYYASAIGDPTNWDYSDPTVGGAFANTGAEGGIIGEPITAMLSHDWNVLLIGCTDSLYAVYGNPRSGVVRRIADVGPIMNSAWCRDAQGRTWMLTRDGLYYVSRGGGEVVKVSRDVLPNELVGINPSAGDIACIGYDQSWPGIHIFVNRYSENQVSYYYKLPDSNVPEGSFWYQEVSSDVHLAPSFPKLGVSGSKSSILPIIASGAVYQFDATGDEEFDSHLFIGPVRLGDVGQEGIVHSVGATVADGSEDVSWELYTGMSAEQAYQSAAPPTFSGKAPHFTGSKWTIDGLNYWQHPRARGRFAYIKLGDVGDERWLMEDIAVNIQPLAMQRVR